MSEAFDKIAAGLSDAIAYTKGDASKGKLNVRLDVLQGQAATTWQVAEQETYSIIADATRALKRAAKRAEALSGEWQRVEFAQHTGPTIEFTGRLLADTSFESRRGTPTRVAFEIWETRAGALVAVSVSTPLSEAGMELVEVTVAEPQDDAQAQRFAVMGHFDWKDGARNMAKKLGWSLRVEID